MNDLPFPSPKKIWNDIDKNNWSNTENKLFYINLLSIASVLFFAKQECIDKALLKVSKIITLANKNKISYREAIYQTDIYNIFSKEDFVYITKYAILYKESINRYYINNYHIFN